MSPQNSDDLFDDSGSFEQSDDSFSGGFDSGSDFDSAGGESMALEQSGMPRPAAPVQRQTFSVYSVMLIMSLVALTAATILFFMEASKY